MNKATDKTTVWTLIPNQYERQIYLVLSSESFYDVIKILNDKYGFDWIEGTDFNKNDDHKAPITVINGDGFKLAIILDKFTGDYKDYSVLAHEIYHVMTNIAKETGADMNDDTSEHWAYFLSFYMDCCSQCLLETQKKKKIPKANK